MNFNENFINNYYPSNYNGNSLNNINNIQFIDNSMNNNNLENSKSDNSNNSEDYNQPKLNIDNTEHKQRKVRKKVTQACENCRKKRRKCTGERPKCLTCLKYNYVCYYNPFPKKRGPQQKIEKRKYKKNEKENDTNNNMEKNKNNIHDSVKFIENVFKIYTKSKEVNITPTIYNNFINYESNINFKSTLNVEEEQIIESELINYSVIDYYYKYFHPSYPIINYNTFIEYIKTDSLSKYLLFAMYALAYLFQPNINVQMAEEYIGKAKALINQNYGKISAQLLQTIFLITVYESGNNQSWVYSGFGMRIVNDSYFIYNNQNNTKDNLVDEIQIMKDISLAIIGYDTWLNIFHFDKWHYKEDIRKFIDKRSKILLCLSNKGESNDFQYIVMSAGLLILEIFHLTGKMKFNDFTPEDINNVNTDIIKMQQYFFTELEKIPSICFNDIVEDFSYYHHHSSSVYSDKKLYFENNPSIYQHFYTKNQKISDNYTLNPLYNNKDIYEYNYPSYDDSLNEISNLKNTSRKYLFENNIAKDSKQCYSEILKRISQDENFFKTKYELQTVKIENVSRSKTVYELYIAINNLKSFYKIKNKTQLLLLTGGQKIYINRIYAQYVIDHPERSNLYPIAKSIALACKCADDCTIGLLLLLETVEKYNYPLRFSYEKSWIFYQCCIIYIIRYVATQEKKFTKYYNRPSPKFSTYSSYPQDTLAPCYYYLDLLKGMRNYFSHVQIYIQAIKLLIYEAEKSVKNKTFTIEIKELL